MCCKLVAAFQPPAAATPFRGQSGLIQYHAEVGETGVLPEDCGHNTHRIAIMWISNGTSYEQAYCEQAP
jgi:hypothetical protein